jgi:hypothetical protein
MPEISAKAFYVLLDPVEQTVRVKCINMYCAAYGETQDWPMEKVLALVNKERDQQQVEYSEVNWFYGWEKHIEGNSVWSALDMRELMFKSGYSSGTPIPDDQFTKNHPELFTKTVQA